MRNFKSLHDKELIAAIRDGAVGIIPSDTVYGLVCSAHNQSAVERLYGLKSREHKPGTVIAATTDQLVELGIKRRYLQAVERFWPGAVSVQIPHDLSYLSQGTGRQAFRIPDDTSLREFLEQTGPLQTTSANSPGDPTATTIQEAKAYFGDRVDFYVDGGDLSDNLPSTIIAIVDDAIEVIRQGAVPVDENGRISKL